MNRSLLVQLVRRDFAARYAGTAMGFFWNVLNPILQLAIYAVVFGKFLGLRAELGGHAQDYTAFLCSGVIPWVGLQDGILKSCTVLVENRSLIRRSSFPLAFLPLSTAISSFLSTAIAMVLLLAFLVGVAHVEWSVWFLLVPVLLGAQTVLVFGVGLLLSAMTVFVRDVAQLVGVVLMVVFWMTPIVYSPEHIPARLAPYLAWSPTAALTAGFRDVLLLARPPSARDVALIAGSGVAALALGFAVSRRLGRDIVSEI